MKKLVLALGLIALMASPAFAERDTKMSLGIDFAMPYVITVDGNNDRDRGNINMGVDLRYWATPNINMGLRSSFDLEEKFGTYRQISLYPGTQYHWMPLERWNPFVRLYVPVVLQGALNTAGSSGKQDVGIGGGVGVAWNLGDAIGVDNWGLRYDFDVQYLFGIGSAVPVLAIDIFRAGIDYHF